MKEKELDVLLTQYESIRQDINVQTSLQNNTINYSIALLAGTFLIVTFKDSQEQLVILQYPIILLLVSILLSFITWSVLEAEIAIHDLTYFIHEKLSKQIRDTLNISQANSDFLKMELPLLAKENKSRSILRAAMVSGKFLISFVPSLILFCMFFRIKVSILDNGFLEWVFAVLAFLFILSIPLMAFFHLRHVSKYYWN